MPAPAQLRLSPTRRWLHEALVEARSSAHSPAAERHHKRMKRRWRRQGEEPVKRACACLLAEPNESVIGCVRAESLARRRRRELARSRNTARGGGASGLDRKGVSIDRLLDAHA